MIARHTFLGGFENNAIKERRRIEGFWPENTKLFSGEERKYIPIMPNDLIICSAFNTGTRCQCKRRCFIEHSHDSRVRMNDDMGRLPIDLLQSRGGGICA